MPRTPRLEGGGGACEAQMLSLDERFPTYPPTHSRDLLEVPGGRLKGDFDQRCGQNVGWSKRRLLRCLWTEVLYRMERLPAPLTLKP